LDFYVNYMMQTNERTKSTETTKRIVDEPILSALLFLGRNGTVQQIDAALKQRDWLLRWASPKPWSTTEASKVLSERGVSSVANEGVQQTQGTPLEKAIAGAFMYFPFGFNEPKVCAGWAWGPTFVVKVPQTYDESAVVALLGDTVKYKELQDYESKVERLTSDAQRCEKPVSIEKAKHGKCTARRVVVADVRGDFEEAIDGGATTFELAFPHVRLLRQLHADKLTTDGESYYVAAWRGEELVGYVVGRHTCEEVEVVRGPGKPKDLA
jgi:hypothetical protein